MPDRIARHGAAIVLALTTLFAAGNVLAAGFAIYEQGTTGLGNAFAGAAAVAEDPTTIFWNPAGMTYLEGSRTAASGSVIVPRSDFTDMGSNIGGGPMGGGIPILGSNGGDGGVAAFVGAFYYSHQMSDDVWFGFGLSAPFGLVTDYDPAWVGRYHAIHSELLTINANPSMAFRVSESLSIGVGLSIQYAYASLSSAICPPNPAGGLLCTVDPSGSLDGFLTFDGSSFGFGGNVGVLWEPMQGTRIGVHYRSQIEQDIGGSGAIATLPTMGGPITVTGGASSTLTLPDSVAISAFHQLTPDIALLADATWMQWSDVPAIVINLSVPGLPPTSTTTLMWDDTWRFSGGAIWQAMDDLLLRIGYAYDESPVPSAAFRTPRVPDNDRHWATIGATYTVQPGVDLSLSYAHLFVPDTPIANDDPSGAPIFLVGEFESGVDIVSFQLTVDTEVIGKLIGRGDE